MKFPCISSNVPPAPWYGVYISQLISVIKVAANKEATEPKVPSGLFEVIPSTVLTSLTVTEYLYQK